MLEHIQALNCTIPAKVSEAYPLKEKLPSRDSLTIALPDHQLSWSDATPPFCFVLQKQAASQPGFITHKRTQSLVSNWKRHLPHEDSWQNMTRYCPDKFVPDRCPVRWRRSPDWPARWTADHLEWKISVNVNALIMNEWLNREISFVGLHTWIRKWPEWNPLSEANKETDILELCQIFKHKAFCGPHIILLTPNTRLNKCQLLVREMEVIHVVLNFWKIGLSFAFWRRLSCSLLTLFWNRFARHLAVSEGLPCDVAQQLAFRLYLNTRYFAININTFRAITWHFQRQHLFLYN